jgi:hypothetical protein
VAGATVLGATVLGAAVLGAAVLGATVLAGTGIAGAAMAGAAARAGGDACMAVMLGRGADRPPTARTAPEMPGAGRRRIRPVR